MSNTPPAETWSTHGHGETVLLPSSTADVRAAALFGESRAEAAALGELHERQRVEHRRTPARARLEPSG